MSLRSATVDSVNTVYAQVIERLTPQTVVETAERMGMRCCTTSRSRRRRSVPYMSAVLGSNEANTLEMASAYGTLATGGRHVEPVPAVTVSDADGNVLWQADPKPQQVIDPQIASAADDILQDVVLYGTGTAANIGRPQIGKTGTDDNHDNAWFIGSVPQLTAAVWVGFHQGQIPMEPPRTRLTVFGGIWPAQIWRLLMLKATAALAAESFPTPDVRYTSIAVDVTQDPVLPAERVHVAAARRGPAFHRRHGADHRVRDAELAAEGPRAVGRRLLPAGRDLDPRGRRVLRPDRGRVFDATGGHRDLPDPRRRARRVPDEHDHRDDLEAAEDRGRLSAPAGRDRNAALRHTEAPGTIGGAREPIRGPADDPLRAGPATPRSSHTSSPADDVGAVECTVDRERLRERPGPRQRSRGRSVPATARHRVEALQGFGRPEQDGAAVILRTGDDVHAVVHAVGEVHVEVARRPEHDRVAGRLRPTYAWLAGSSGSYASVSTIRARNIRSPGSRRTRSRPSRAGATSRAGARRNVRGSREPTLGQAEQEQEQRLLGVHAVLGLIPHGRGGSVDHLVRDLVAAVRRQAMQDDRGRIREGHQLAG